MSDRQPDSITLEDVEEARKRLDGIVTRTPLVWLDDGGTGELYLKLENLHPIRSFKIRGAANAIAMLGPEELEAGVYTASAGNMAQGVAWNARRLGLTCSVVVPAAVPSGTRTNRPRGVAMFAATVIESPCTWTGIASSRVVRVIPRSGAANAIRRARRLGGCDELSDRQRSRVSSSGGSPTSVNGASTRASPPESRSTGAAWPSCESLESGAASCTGTRHDRSSFAIASIGTAKLAWSRSPCASVSRPASS